MIMRPDRVPDVPLAEFEASPDPTEPGLSDPCPSVRGTYRATGGGASVGARRLRGAFRSFFSVVLLPYRLHLR
jgi:hypothetical protein